MAVAPSRSAALAALPAQTQTVGVAAAAAESAPAIHAGTAPPPPPAPAAAIGDCTTKASYEESAAARGSRSCTPCTSCAQLPRTWMSTPLPPPALSAGGSAGGLASRARKPEATPPAARTRKRGAKSERKRALSWPWQMRTCAQPPPRASESWTVRMAAAPFSSWLAWLPIQ